MTMADKKSKTTKKAASKAKADAAPATTPNGKAAKPPREKKEKVPMRTFAIRITDAELAAIHKAAGPRNASRFMTAVAAAFAAGDDAAFKAVVKEAREQRA
jgi:hypothetical protein